ncbi:MAG TPA: hypothetical protein VFE47_27020 [Tepidisphaeraceae bacterium]|jgi:antitoxin component YwqK of YwqJK toxin-antitoxin module|nr:hypothetical protein [Tepidisphaeraceae bacterium]
MERVELKELLDEADGTYSFRGRPFSGVAFDLLPSGSLWSEITFVEGHQEGLARTWYENGQLKSEGIFLGATLHGPSKEWFASGRLKNMSLCEFGICVEGREWDEDGKLVKDFHLDPSDYNYAALLEQRAAFRKQE